MNSETIKVDGKFTATSFVPIKVVKVRRWKRELLLDVRGHKLWLREGDEVNVNHTLSGKVNG